MKSRILAAALATVSLLTVLRAEDPSSPPINPALLYWQAAAQLPKLTDDQAREMRGMAEGKLPVDPEMLKRLELGSAENLLRKAAASSAPCDWGLSKDDGPFLALPHISKILELARVAAVEAEAKLAQGKTEEGIEWLLTAHRIARHSGAGDSILSFLVQNSIESMAFKAAARHCLLWDETSRHGYSAKLKSLPPLHSLADAYHGELSMAAWLERQLDGPEPERRKMLELLYTEMGCKPSGQLTQASAEQYFLQFKPEPMKKLIAEYRDLIERTQRAAGKPWKVGRPDVDVLKEGAKNSEFILIRQSYPPLADIYDREYQLVTMRTMLHAALECGAQIDEAKAAAYQDAFEGNPLRLQKSADGALVLAAAEQHPAGKPIALNLGKIVR